MITDFWSILNISSRQIEWVLNKALPDITLSKQSITLDSDNLTDTFTITTNSTGNLSVVSSDNSIATVSLSGNTVTVEALTNGTCTITVSVTESADNNYLSGSKELSVTCNLLSTTLNDNSWETISQMSQDGTASNYWSVGDTKEVVLNGNTTNASNSTKSFNNYSCYATILGFNHNASLETNGEHSIHFILGKDNTGKDICFCPYRMNEGDITTGGWNGSKMKTTTMTEFKNCLPADLRAVLKNVTKYTHNTTGGSRSQSAANVTATTEQVFLLSEFEVQGARTHANQYEKGKQAQYAYYANGNSKVRYRDDSPTSAYSWWVRSAHCDNDFEYAFCIVNSIGDAGTGGSSNGYFYSGGANSGYGVSPAFVV